MEHTWRLITYGMITGILYTFAISILGYVVSRGSGGPLKAVQQTQCFWHLILNFIIYREGVTTI